MASSFGPRPLFPTDTSAPAYVLPTLSTVTILDGLLHCSSHMKQVCLECNVDYSTHNFLTRQLTANRGALPPPNPQLASAIQKLKTEGNDQFRAQCHFEAAQKYTEAINVAAQRPLWDSAQTSMEEMAVLMSNRAACLLELGHASEAYWDTEVVTRLKRAWSKGHFRMGRALMGLGRCGQAANEFQIGSQLDPEAKEMKSAVETVQKLV
ncbi:hypothetical protein GGI13_000642 [Coemansia sp. RSA 455]|nr:hypothetical protein GGI14_005223 [Coemansia sp. S680]KAJ2041669.1 hypothetical protein H4S03_000204 [Coemansia sp. S3946]KAJ2053168.1 hypothetical protein H4S04_000848 [Coemansia sp. S16]KAJ2074056.1 hypothetical protein GGH13_001577 [Coemansia sp. S155-1]KAJ2104191.1 hypothetical protein GGI09_000238 [Coemansia sp. S100]KAJ2108552.1 hypothetical protein GGI16_001086 [Coemansia sp. S142-1]KAJ2117186.1 hypothetical protein IW146_000954 [Coemansia sp. RSA 922]KAJ2258277.1 hypothetical prot